MSTELVQVLQEFGLSEEKKNVVNGLLKPFFDKAEEWKEQVDSIVITDPSQTDKMALAKTGRLQLKNRRLEAEKLVKDQRQSIKARVADDMLEDKLWLRSGQIMEAVFKNLETKLEEKEKFAERWEAEQKEIRRQERISKLSTFGAIEIPGLADMTDEQFNTYLSGVEAQYLKRIEEEKAEQERQRIQALHNERYSRLSRYADFIPGLDEMKLGELSEEDFVAIGTKAKADKDAHDKEQARIKAENERLQKEKEEAERKQREALEQAEKARKEAEAKAQAEQKRIQDEANAKLKAEQEKARKAQEEADRLKQAEEARKQAEAKAEADRLAEEQRIAQQDIYERLNAWIDTFELPPIPGGGYPGDSQQKVQGIQEKFLGFKKWAKDSLKQTKS